MSESAVPVSIELLRTVPDAAYIVDRDRTVTSWNTAAEAISGFGEREVLGHWCGGGMLSHVDGDGAPMCGDDQCPLLGTMLDGQPRQTRVLLHHRAGHLVPVVIEATPVRDGQGDIVGAMETFRPDTERFAEPAPAGESRAATDVDPVTGLGTRGALEVRLAERLVASSRGGAQVGVLMCGVDDFVDIAGSHGHPVADRALQVLARTFEHCLPGPGRTFRYGHGFVGLMAHDELLARATQLCAFLEASRIALPDEVLHVTASIGATMAHPGEDYADVLHRASRLLGAAQRAGGSCVVTDVARDAAASDEAAGGGPRPSGSECQPAD